MTVRPQRCMGVKCARRQGSFPCIIGQSIACSQPDREHLTPRRWSHSRIVKSSPAFPFLLRTLCARFSPAAPASRRRPHVVSPPWAIRPNWRYAGMAGLTPNVLRFRTMLGLSSMPRTHSQLIILRSTRPQYPNRSRLNGVGAPPVRHSRFDYNGVSMGFRLIRGCDADKVFEHYRQRAQAEGPVPEMESRFNCKLTQGQASVRNRVFRPRASLSHATSVYMVTTIFWLYAAREVGQATQASRISLNRRDISRRRSHCTSACVSA